jgi:hypothetical protein
LRHTAFLAHRIAAHIDAMGVVNQAVQNAVGGRGVADRFMPARDRELRGEDRRASLVTVFADLPEVATLGFGEGRHGPVVARRGCARNASTMPSRRAAFLSNLRKFLAASAVRCTNEVGCGMRSSRR